MFLPIEANGEIDGTVNISVRILAKVKPYSEDLPWVSTQHSHRKDPLSASFFTSQLMNSHINCPQTECQENVVSNFTAYKSRSASLRGGSVPFNNQLHRTLKNNFSTGLFHWVIYNISIWLFWAILFYDMSRRRSRDLLGNAHEIWLYVSRSSTYTVNMQ